MIFFIIRYNKKKQMNIFFTADEILSKKRQAVKLKAQVAAIRENKCRRREEKRSKISR